MYFIKNCIHYLDLMEIKAKHIIFLKPTENRGNKIQYRNFIA